MPADGFTRLFENMLDHEGIHVETGLDYSELRCERLANHTIFTGPIDDYFDQRFGPLPYRSLEFNHQTLDQAWFQSVGVINYPSEDVRHTQSYRIQAPNGAKPLQDEYLVRIRR